MPNRRKVGKFWEVWVICPICNKGRWIREGITKQPRFTGRCKPCNTEIARQEMGLYYIPKGK